MALTDVKGADLIGSGGEADVYTVPGRPDLVEKRWRNPTFQQARKLDLMLAHPPEGAVVEGHVNLAWPVAPVNGEGAEVLGFRMPAVDLARSVPLFCAYNPHARREEMAGITWRHLVRGGRNLAATVAALHRSGYVVGDLNESNVLIDRRALVTILDCDSIQVPDPRTGEVHFCTVARPDFLAPELAGRDLSSTVRRESADRFALAVMLFLMLREGVHPYAGVWRGRGEPPDLTARMRGRRFPYLFGSSLRPPPHSLRMTGLGMRIRFMFLSAFVLGPWLRPARPSAGAWALALAKLEQRLAPCRRSPQHLKTGRRCPWCRRVDGGLPDAWPSPDGKAVRARRPSLLTRTGRAASTWAKQRSRRAFARVRWWGGAPVGAALAAAVLVVPSVCFPVLAAALVAVRWRTGSGRASARFLLRLWRVARRLPQIWWWSIVTALAAAELLAGPPF